MDTAKIIVGIIHIILSVLIIALILLQSGKQAGLSGAVAGAGESFFGKNKGRTMDAIFSRFTKICAIGFLITSLFLAYSYAIGDTTAQQQQGTNSVEMIDPSTMIDPAAGADQLTEETQITDDTQVTENTPAVE